MVDLQASHSTRAPLFVVGLPRTGTTALTNALNAHPGIILSMEWRTISLLTAGLDWTGVLRYYHDRVNLHDWDASRYIGDKFPWFRELTAPGPYFQHLPDAKIIWTYRNPVDQIRSIMQHNQAEGDEGYHYKRWCADRDNRARLRATDKNRLQFINYAEFTAHPEFTLHKLCEWLDLPRTPPRIAHMASDVRGLSMASRVNEFVLARMGFTFG